MPRHKPSYQQMMRLPKTEDDAVKVRLDELAHEMYAAEEKKAKKAGRDYEPYFYEAAVWNGKPQHAIVLRNLVAQADPDGLGKLIKQWLYG
jgi:hypothetical protein